MNIKKLVITGAAAALILGSGVAAFANEHHNNNNGGTSVRNTGSINNESWNVANTGLNYVGGSESNNEHHRRGHDNGNSVTTGDAVASQSVWNEIDTTSNCGCSTSGRHGSNGGTSVRNSGDVNNLSVNVANTGANYVDGKTSLDTGNAAAGQDVTNIINTSVGASAE